MPNYYNTVTQEIVDYPEDAAALFPALKRVPSERADNEQADEDDAPEVKVELTDSKARSTKNGEVNAK